VVQAAVRHLEWRTHVHKVRVDLDWPASRLHANQRFKIVTAPLNYKHQSDNVRRESHTQAEQRAYLSPISTPPCPFQMSTLNSTRGPHGALRRGGGVTSFLEHFPPLIAVP
jgi:hypothetical protein